MRAIVFPGKYYQGEGALKNIGNVIASFNAKKVYIIWGKRAKQSVFDVVNRSLKENQIKYKECLFTTDCKKKLPREWQKKLKILIAISSRALAVERHSILQKLLLFTRKNE